MYWKFAKAVRNVGICDDMSVCTVFQKVRTWVWLSTYWFGTIYLFIALMTSF